MREVDARPAWSTSIFGVVSSAQPTESSIGFVECGSVKHCAEEEREEVAVVAEPVVDVVLRPTFVGVERLVERIATRSLGRRRAPAGRLAR